MILFYNKGKQVTVKCFSTRKYRPCNLLWLLQWNTFIHLYCRLTISVEMELFLYPWTLLKKYILFSWSIEENINPLVAKWQLDKGKHVVYHCKWWINGKVPMILMNKSCFAKDKLFFTEVTNWGGLGDLMVLFH